MARALTQAAIPLEALHASVTWELAPELKEEIAKALTVIREEIMVWNEERGKTCQS
jgi:hypothetical protein